MILIFSEAQSDYKRYQFPYVIWAVPEPPETPASLIRQGFLPGTPRMDRFYVCRNLRVVLSDYRPTSENRRILKKGAGIQMEFMPRAGFEYNTERRTAWTTYANQRFGEGVMTGERLDTLLNSPLVTHLFTFRDSAMGSEVGTVLLYVEEPALAYYCYAFYDLEYVERSLGSLMMTRAVEFFAQRGVQHLHLGTCYSERSLYKTQFNSVQFFNGIGWSSDLAELKHLIRREQSGTEPHLLETPDFLDRFYGGNLQRLTERSRFRVSPPAGPDNQTAQPPSPNT